MSSKTKTTTAKAGKIFYGWWILTAGSLLCLFGYGGWYYSFGALFNPISAEFGWSRATTSLAFSLARIEGGIEGLITGPLVDRFGPRVVVRIGWTMAALGFFMMYFIDSFWMFIVSYSLLLTLGMDAGLYVPIQTTVAKWFNKKRGMAMGLLTSGGALGGALVVPIVAWLIVHYGWRESVLVLAAAVFVIGWGLSFVLRPHGPEHYGLQMDGAKQNPSTAKVAAYSEPASTSGSIDSEGLTLKQALKTRAFWMLATAAIFAQTALAAVVVHQIPFIEDMGISKVVAASALGTMTVMSIPGRLSGGWLADRWNVQYLYFIASIVQAVGLFSLARATSMSGVWLFVVIYGLSYGMRITIDPTMRGRLFGHKAFGSIMGYLGAFGIIGSFTGPFFAGWVFDTTHSYTIAFLCFAGAMLIAGTLVLLIKPPLSQAQS